MKGMKGRILKKLKSIPRVTYLKEGRILHLNASDGLPDPSPSPRNPKRVLSELPVCAEDPNLIPSPPPPISPKPEIIDVEELMKDLDDEDDDDKENCSPAPSHPTPWKKKQNESIDDGLPFRRPELDSESLFDPDLLAAFEKAVMDHIRSYEEAKTTHIESRGLNEDDPHCDLEPPSKIPRIDVAADVDVEADEHDPLTEFEYRCPPGGEESVLLYTTTLRGIRKTFEDCVAVRFLLESSRVEFRERDLSMHYEFREQLWSALDGKAIPPRLFVRGRYIGGVEDVLRLHEQGRLLPLLKGMPRAAAAACGGCGGVRFVLCSACSGGRKLYADGGVAQCRRCNENGLVLCPICCC